MSEVMGTIETLDSVESLLNTDLADLAALAELKVPPVGRYKLSLTVETKDDGAHPQVQMKYEVMECIEQVNADETPAKAGDAFYVSYNVDNKFGLGKLQKDLQPFAAYFSQSNIGEILQSIDGIQIEGTVKQRIDTKNTDDEGKPRVYGTVVNIAVQ